MSSIYLNYWNVVRSPERWFSPSPVIPPYGQIIPVTMCLSTPLLIEEGAESLTDSKEGSHTEEAINNSSPSSKEESLIDEKKALKGNNHPSILKRDMADSKTTQSQKGNHYIVGYPSPELSKHPSLPLTFRTITSRSRQLRISLPPSLSDLLRSPYHSVFALTLRRITSGNHRPWFPSIGHPDVYEFAPPLILRTSKTCRL